MNLDNRTPRVPSWDTDTTPVQTSTAETERAPSTDRSPWGAAAPAPTSAWAQQSSPAVAVQPVRTGARGRRTAGTILGAALLSAVLASGSTFAVVQLAMPHPSAAAAPTAANATNAAQGGTTQTTVQQEDITGVVAAAKDSVVTLTSEIATDGGGFGGGTATGIGTGIVLTADGYVLTNRHVVEGSQSLKATLNDGSEHPATVVTVSDTQDLALVKVDVTGLKPATIGDSNGVEVGQTAIAIGSPLGTYTETVTKGIVSALDRTITVRDDQTGRPVTLKGLIQTDAAINPGNSGGPLLNAAGAVVGVNTATASSAEGIGFAIPLHEAQSLIDQARTASVA
jgi:serine protease Do